MSTEPTDSPVTKVAVTTVLRAGRVTKQKDCYTREALEDAAGMAADLHVCDATGKTHFGEIREMGVNAEGDLIGVVRIRKKNRPLLEGCVLSASIKSLEVSLRKHQGVDYVLHRRVLFLSFRVCSGEEP